MTTADNTADNTAAVSGDATRSPADVQAARQKRKQEKKARKLVAKRRKEEGRAGGIGKKTNKKKKNQKQAQQQRQQQQQQQQRQRGDEQALSLAGLVRSTGQDDGDTTAAGAGGSPALLPTPLVGRHACNTSGALEPAMAAAIAVRSLARSCRLALANRPKLSSFGVGFPFTAWTYHQMVETKQWKGMVLMIDWCDDWLCVGSHTGRDDRYRS